jgi:UPF0755 protein
MDNKKKETQLRFDFGPPRKHGKRPTENKRRSPVQTSRRSGSAPRKAFSAQDALARQQARQRKKSIPAPKAKPIAKKLPATKRAPQKKRSAPVRKKPVLPPTIGTRKGYTPTWLGRIKPIAFILSAVICCTVVFFYFCSQGSDTIFFGQEQNSMAAGSPIEGRDSRVVEIVGGMTARQVCELLEDMGITGDGQVLLEYLVSHDLASVLRSGSYLMDAGMKDEEIASMLTNRASVVEVTIPPGYTIGSIDTYLASRGYAGEGEFLEAAESLREAYGLSFVEGWLLGGSYSISSKQGADDLVLAMYRSMLQVLQPMLDAPEIARYGVNSVLIVASMIQAETQNPEEMPLIASVIYNRLEEGEPLGIDATTRYELDDWEHPIPVSALEKQTPYNTRRRVGLVPTGICCPSSDAVAAACYPADTDFRYYLHGTDKQLHLAKDYEQHKQNIAQYR